MKRIRIFIRLIHINFILARHGIDKMMFAYGPLVPLRFLAYVNPFNWFRHKDETPGEAIRQALVELGPIFVKFGQALSTRRDLIPDEIADELEKLQDKVPPFSGEFAKKCVEKTYGKPIDEIFLEFDTTALASASIAQVHAAKLFSGQEVVVKILRPKMRQVIRRDIAVMYTFAKLINKYWEDGRRLRPIEVVKEFEKTIFDELDLMREAANASQLRRNFPDSEQLYIPEIYWPYSKEKVMVMERIHGIPITKIEELKQAGINLKKLAERGVEIFFTQVFRDCFFHADMHPGNVFVSTDNPENPQYIAVDFGIMGSLNASDQRYLAENFLAFFNRDYKRVAELHVESGWVPSNTRIDEFESAIRTVCEPIFERPLGDISVAQVLMRLFQTGRRFNMEVQPQLVLMQKTFFAVEGLGRMLYPQLDLWNTAKPFLEKWLREKVGTKAMLMQAYKHYPYWAEKFPDVPDLVYDALTYMRQMKLQGNVERISKTDIESLERKSVGKGVAGGFILALLLGAGGVLLSAHLGWIVLSVT